MLDISCTAERISCLTFDPKQSFALHEAQRDAHAQMTQDVTDLQVRRLVASPRRFTLCTTVGGLPHTCMTCFAHSSASAM